MWLQDRTRSFNSLVVLKQTVTMQATQLRAQASQGVARAHRGSRARCVSVHAKKVANGPKIAIVGVTGAVGQEFMEVSCSA